MCQIQIQAPLWPLCADQLVQNHLKVILICYMRFPSLKESQGGLMLA